MGRYLKIIKIIYLVLLTKFNTAKKLKDELEYNGDLEQNCARWNRDDWLIWDRWQEGASKECKQGRSRGRACDWRDETWWLHDPCVHREDQRHQSTWWRRYRWSNDRDNLPLTKAIFDSQEGHLWSRRNHLLRAFVSGIKECWKEGCWRSQDYSEATWQRLYERRSNRIIWLWSELYIFYEGPHASPSMACS